MNTIILSVITGVTFGIALFLRKLSLQQIGVSAFIFEAVVEALLAIIIVPILFHTQITNILTKPLGIFYGVLAGVIISIGLITYFIAIKSGALTPAVISPILAALTASTLTILILREPVTVLKLAGMLIALAGLYIFIKY